jgi:hypothetical protein
MFDEHSKFYFFLEALKPLQGFNVWFYPVTGRCPVLMKFKAFSLESIELRNPNMFLFFQIFEGAFGPTL